MEPQQFEAAQVQVLQWLTQLTGKQADELPDTFERCSSLATCLAILAEAGSKLRHCPHCQSDRLCII